MENVKIGLAIDIGTTTVVLHLVNIKTDEKLVTVSGINAQSAYGADVTSRIMYCAQNGHEKLTALIRKQVLSMMNEACRSAGVKSTDIEKISIAANTIMQHIIAGYSPVSMGVAPFTPISLFGKELPAWEGLLVSSNAKIYYTPAISAYVGGDITAGLLAAGFEDITEPAIFLDIGTNGEIVLKHKGTYYCCATAAGPAFEGAEIAKGLCGSGLIDMLAVLLDTGVVDSTGRLLGCDKHYLSQEQDVYITAEDIRKLQLAKAAIAAGIQVLIHFAGITEKDITLLALAGGFGNNMDLNSAVRIGLFPKSLLPVAKTYGNTAGEGATIALVSNVHSRLNKIRTQCEYIELSTMTFFNDKFVDEMAF